MVKLCTRCKREVESKRYKICLKCRRYYHKTNKKSNRKKVKNHLCLDCGNKVKRKYSCVHGKLRKPYYPRRCRRCQTKITIRCSK